MCFGSQNERNDDPPARPAQNYDGGRTSETANQYSAPPPGYHSQQHHQQNRPHEDFAPPPGPPPGRRQEDDFAPPPGPPPGRQQQDDFAPPPGPPPSHQQGDFAPPPGPPPSKKDDWIAPPSDPYDAQSSNGHDWQAAVPDTSLFPPPPMIFSGHDRSPANNATEEEAEEGEKWCRQYDLVDPIVLDQPGKIALQHNNFRLLEPVGFNGRLKFLAPGHWEGHTNRNSPDQCFIGYPPLFVVKEHHPKDTEQPKTIYYEVTIRRNSPTINLALGFTALPYPSFRLPGWHRGSLAVHGDDGHKYINDLWGGKDFTSEFRAGDTYGIGMTFPKTGDVDVFFTKNGERIKEWPLHEETDARQDLPVTGLEGLHDLSCAIGAFDATDFEVVFDPSKWLYREARFDL
ncbi:hypothetical protein MKX08_008865 [Trichoderma sp. CBMAI-0020]|nr:hypothetical protein MKX08_008865 [Trichoderma sp. CBMAI-0020]